MTSNIFHKHSIVIRYRSTWELTDLAGRVLRDQWRPICFYFFILALLATVLNIAVFWSCFGFGPIMPSAEDSSDALLEGRSLWFYSFICLASFVELRFVGTLLVTWLGIWVFHPDKQVPVREVFAVWFNALPQLLFYLVLFYPFYLFYPFVSQIILLERTRFFRHGTLLTTSRRAAYFHRGLGGDVRQLRANAEILVVFFLLVGSAFFFSWGETIFFSSPLWPIIFRCVVFPIYVWSLMLAVCVLSFFQYLNIRIMREGWDLDIAFKAEMIRLQDRFPQETITPVSFDLNESFGCDDYASQIEMESAAPKPDAASAFVISTGDDLTDVAQMADGERVTRSENAGGVS
ncbi:MAG: hypothetical protein Q4G59_11745 [Planctomycetia bacterium]|nr:hypothetical protein [Planctomycetia bacterium]